MARSTKTSAPENRGASRSQVTQKDLLQGWYSHHLLCALSSLKQLFAAPVQSVMTWLVIAIALALPAALLLAVNNIKLVGKQWQADPRITVYLKPSLTETVVTQVGQHLQALPGILAVEYVSPAQGLEELKQYGGFGEALSLLQSNPLPPVYLLKPADRSEAALAMMIAQLRRVAEVDDVQVDLLWVQRLEYFTLLAQRMAGLLGFFLCLGVLLTIGNTTRLAIEKRRDEIVVLKLVGGTDAFVRRPLLYTGMWYGLVGGLMAWLLLLAASARLAPVARQLLESYGMGQAVQGLGVDSLFLLLGAGGALGLAGAWLAVGRHLKAIQPS